MPDRPLLTLASHTAHTHTNKGTRTRVRITRVRVFFGLSLIIRARVLRVSDNLKNTTVHNSTAVLARARPPPSVFSCVASYLDSSANTMVLGVVHVYVTPGTRGRSQCTAPSKRRSTVVTRTTLCPSSSSRHRGVNAAGLGVLRQGPGRWRPTPRGSVGQAAAHYWVLQTGSFCRPVVVHCKPRKNGLRDNPK